MSGWRLGPGDGGRTIADLARHTWDLRLKCGGCGREEQQAYRDLVRRFRTSLGATVAELAERATCRVCAGRAGHLYIVNGQPSAGFAGQGDAAERQAAFEALLAEIDGEGRRVR